MRLFRSEGSLRNVDNHCIWVKHKSVEKEKLNQDSGCSQFFITEDIVLDNSLISIEVYFSHEVLLPHVSDPFIALVQHFNGSVFILVRDLLKTRQEFKARLQEDQ